MKTLTYIPDHPFLHSYSSKNVYSDSNFLLVQQLVVSLSNKTTIIMSTREGLWESIMDMIYPPQCASCSRIIERNNFDFVCLECAAGMSELDLQFYRENPLTEHFWGRFNIENSACLYSFSPAGKIQKIIHKIKYNGIRKIAFHMGILLGEVLESAEWFDDIDIILPVPIHWKRRYTRGYNQSYAIAQGIQERTGKPISKKILKRKIHTITQTGKNRIDRVDNLHNSIIAHPAISNYQHVLIVDDVITTGATIESTALALHKIHDIKISVACLAIGGL